MDRLDLVNLVPEWRTGRDRRGNVLSPQVAEGKRLCADELEAVIRNRLTIGTDVKLRDGSDTEGEIMGAYRVSRAHPIIYIVKLEGGGEGTYMRQELDAQMPEHRRPEIDPLSAEATQEAYSDITGHKAEDFILPRQGK